MKINRLIGISLASMAIIGLAACGSKNSTNSETTTSTILDSTELVTGENLATVSQVYTAADALSYEELVAYTCERAMNSTIVVENYQTIVTTYNSMFGHQTTEKSEHGLYGFGSGVIYYKAETSTGEYLYKLVTNEHVVSVDSGYKTISDEEEFKLYDESYDEEITLELVGKDAENDIAVLTFVSDRDYTAVAFENTANVKVGNSVIAVGTPLDFEYYNTCTFGIISKINSSSIQHDAAINSGNSGGALFNLNGNLVGINNAKLSGSTSSGTSIDGIYFAIPVSIVMDSITSITGLTDFVTA